MKLIVNYSGREKRYAVIDGDRVEKLVIEQPKKRSLVGNIYLGKVTKVLPGMDAVFVDIGAEKNGFLHRDKIPAFVQAKGGKSISSSVHEGEQLLVQVEKDATGTKGPRLTGIVEFGGRSVVYMPEGSYVAVSKKITDGKLREKWRRFGLKIKEGNEGFLFRTACSSATEDEVMEEIRRLKKEYGAVLAASEKLKTCGLVYEADPFLKKMLDEIGKWNSGEVIVDDLPLKKKLEQYGGKTVQITYYREKENIFSAFHLDHEIEKALKKIVWLENGAYLIFEEMETLTFIDVNTGKFTGKDDMKETVAKTNDLAAAEIARQLRLRDIGGMILIDFIDMKDKEDEKKIVRTLERELAKDDKRTVIAGFTPLGILQLTRKKTKVSLAEELLCSCPVCSGTGKIESPETVAYKLERELLAFFGMAEEGILIETTEEVKNIFSGEKGEFRTKMEGILGAKLFFKLVKDEKPFYAILHIGKEVDCLRKMGR